MVNVDSLKGFGFSLASNGQNLDNDKFGDQGQGFGDLVIGSLSDAIIVLRSRPIIDVIIETECKYF